MPGLKIMMQNEEGQYGNAAHTLMYKGYMLVYDPQKDVLEWVLMRGMSASLTSLELRSVNDLNNINPYPHIWQGLTDPHSPKLVWGIPRERKRSWIRTAGVSLLTLEMSGMKPSMVPGHAVPFCLWGTKVPHGWKSLLKLCREKLSLMNQLSPGKK